MTKMKTIMTAVMVAGVAFTAQASHDNPDQPRTIINCVNGDDLQVVLKQHFPEQLDPAAEDGPKGDFYKLPSDLRRFIWKMLGHEDQAKLRASAISLTMLPANHDRLDNQVNDLLNQLNDSIQKRDYSERALFEGKKVRLKNGSQAFIPFSFNSETLLTHPLGPGLRNQPAMAAILSSINSMVHKASNNKDESAILGLQAARLILLRFFPEIHPPYSLEYLLNILDRFYTSHQIVIPYKKLPIGSTAAEGDRESNELHLKPAVASTLEEILQALLIKEDGNEIRDIAHSTIALLRMAKFPRSMEDVRFAVRELLQIKYFKYFSILPYVENLDEDTILNQMCADLIGGSPQFVVMLGRGIASFAIDDESSRSLEEKKSDFYLLRDLAQHAVNNLGIPVAKFLDLETLDFLKEYAEIFVNDRQAELFVEYGDLDRFFK